MEHYLRHLFARCRPESGIRPARLQMLRWNSGNRFGLSPFGAFRCMTQHRKVEKILALVELDLPTATLAQTKFQ